jgi:hypothetical protein
LTGVRVADADMTANEIGMRAHIHGGRGVHHCIWKLQAKKADAAATKAISETK